MELTRLKAPVGSNYVDSFTEEVLIGGKRYPFFCERIIAFTFDVWLSLMTGQKME
jgi:hypothetical protein